MTDKKPVEHRQFTKIEGLSERRRLPRLGKLHLGIKVQSPGAKSEYPKATDYFVVEAGVMGEAIEKAYGKNPKSLTVLLPTTDPAEFFPQEYKSYKSGVGKWCHGNGVRAQRVMQGGGWEDIACPGMGNEVSGLEPCPIFKDKKCKCMANLLVILPFVSMYGVFQIDTSSLNSIVDINSGIDAIRKASEETGTPMNHIPATLRIVTRQVSPDGKRKAVHTMVLTVASHQEIIKIKSQLTAIREALGGDVMPALPPVEQSRYEETDLIPASVQVEPEVLEAEVPAAVGAQPKESPPAGSDVAPSASVPAEPGMRMNPPDSLYPGVKAGWAKTMPMAVVVGIREEEQLLAVAQDITKKKPGCLEELTVEDWRELYAYLREMKNKGGTVI